MENEMLSRQGNLDRRGVERHVWNSTFLIAVHTDDKICIRIWTTLFDT